MGRGARQPKAALEGGSVELTPGEEQLVEIFRALGQRSRFALWLWLARKCVCLGEEGDYCSGLQKWSGLAQSTVSHHLKVLRQTGLVEPRQEGTWCCYRVEPRVYEAITALLSRLTSP